MNKEEPPRHIFASGAVRHTIVFKFSISVFGPKTNWRDDLVENPNLNSNNNCYKNSL